MSKCHEVLRCAQDDKGLGGNIMDSTATPEEAAFRKEVRAWLDANATRKSDDKQSFRARNDDPELLKKAKEWQDKKAKAGYARTTAPPDTGGPAAAAPRAAG